MTATAAADVPSVWLTVKEAAARVKVSPGLIYLNVKMGRLRAARLGFRNDIRIREDWLDAWVVSLSTPHEIETPEQTAAIAFTRHGRKR